MQREISLNLLRELDPLALGPIAEGRSAYYTAKRILDITLAALALICLSPVMALIAILIKLDSSGPIFFVQERVGAKLRKYNHIAYWQQVNFCCYKFRTMVCNADPAIHQAYVKALIHNDKELMADLQGSDTQIRKLTHDPRITRLGKILRMSSLDEIPQFWNVIKGDMSLVGPRPEVPYTVELYKPWHRRRLETKPGMTGLWQVTARCSADFEESIRLDIQYIEQQSLRLDLKILLKTPLAVISCKGAV
jgi:lipopolysaccharide/colanic/teichoic acid biosynthesis glycosyltransferase